MHLIRRGWHGELLAHVKELLTNLETKFGFKQVANLGNKLSKKALPSTPLISAEDLADLDATALRIDTVHKAKGESLDAVLYMTSREHAEALLGRVATEVGRIGYVAATRARDLLWVAVPRNSFERTLPELLTRGFKEACSPATPAPATSPHELISLSDTEVRKRPLTIDSSSQKPSYKSDRFRPEAAAENGNPGISAPSAPRRGTLLQRRGARMKAEQTVQRTPTGHPR